MDWQGREESSNVQDRRNMKTTGLAIGGGATIIIVLLALFLGGDPKALLSQLQQQQKGSQPANRKFSPEEEKAKKFVGVVLRDTELVWGELFPKYFGKKYKQPQLILFTAGTQSGCGFASSAVGPFYCPADEHVYLDLSFFDEMKTRFRAPGDFAQAYVVAHEVGHHVQHLLGISDTVHRKQQQSLSKAAKNRLSVRLELQADFLAGVWAHNAQRKFGYLDEGDIGEAIRAAQAIGDDTLQKQATGRVMPDSFTHGTSEQRIRWFTEGFRTGNLSRMNALFDLPYEQL